MYIDIGPGASATSTIGFTFMALAATRSWEIKVTQLECGNPMTPPDGCLQYHTGSAGQLTTFNYAGNALHLADQNYNICIRQEMGKTINTSYLTDSYITFTLKLESGQNFCCNRSIRSSTYCKKNIFEIPPCGSHFLLIHFTY